MAKASYRTIYPLAPEWVNRLWNFPQMSVSQMTFSLATFTLSHYYCLSQKNTVQGLGWWPTWHLLAKDWRIIQRLWCDRLTSSSNYVHQWRAHSCWDSFRLSTKGQCALLPAVLTTHKVCEDSQRSSFLPFMATKWVQLGPHRVCARVHWGGTCPPQKLNCHSGHGT